MRDTGDSSHGSSVVDCFLFSLGYRQPFSNLPVELNEKITSLLIWVRYLLHAWKHMFGALCFFSSVCIYLVSMVISCLALYGGSITILDSANKCTTLYKEITGSEQETFTSCSKPLLPTNGSPLICAAILHGTVEHEREGRG